MHTRNAVLPASLHTNLHQILIFTHIPTHIHSCSPRRVSEAEMRIIEMVPRPPCSILLLGRSGTGKTTVLVFRWAQ